MSAESAQTTPERSELVTTEHRLGTWHHATSAARAVRYLRGSCPDCSLGAVVAEADGGSVEFRRPWVVWRPLVGTSRDQRRDRADPLAHLKAIRDQSVGLDGGRRCPDIGSSRVLQKPRPASASPGGARSALACLCAVRADTLRRSGARASGRPRTRVQLYLRLSAPRNPRRVPA